MKSQLLIIGLMISSLLAISASAQKLTTIEDVTLQDDRSGDHLIFVIATGQYKFESCKGKSSLSRFGKITVTGCKVSLKDMTETRRVLAEVDLCNKVGKADVAFVGDALTSRTDPATLEFVLSDSNTTDSTFDSVPKTIDPK